jgi:hypothetical protein
MKSRPDLHFDIPSLRPLESFVERIARWSLEHVLSNFVEMALANQ